MFSENSKEKGITLIALVVTIVVLIILAGISISMLTGQNGIINRASEAKTKTGLANEREAVDMAALDALTEGKGKITKETITKTLKSYLGKNDIELKGEGPLVYDGENNTYIIEITGEVSVMHLVSEFTGNEMLNNTEKTIAYDKYGNKIVIPSGFKVLIDNSTGYTEKNIDVTKGIVIEDSNKNQFVWIPTGKIYTNEEQSEYKTIKLSRYNFADGTDKFIDETENILTIGTEIDIGNKGIAQIDRGHEYIEYENKQYGNEVALNLNDFLNSAKKNNGYYIGRYETRDFSTTEKRNEQSTQTNKAVINSVNSIYNYVTQFNASKLSQNMYKDNSTVTSDLINSYAWDTALVYIQKFSGNSVYSYSAGNNQISNFGTLTDTVLNIFDIASNCSEYTTETATNRMGYPCVLRGIPYKYGGEPGRRFWDTSFNYVAAKSEDVTFRIILYLSN